MPGPALHYPLEFKKETVQLYHSSEKSIRKLAEELGIVSECLRRWIRQLEIDTVKREGLTTEEHEELRGLLPSMEQVGSAYDRSLAESFVATLNTELLYRPCWSTHQMA
jgi:transposase